MKLRADLILEFPELPVIVETFFVKKHISSLTQIVIQLHPDIPTTVL